jgi:hypothetical protein
MIRKENSPITSSWYLECLIQTKNLSYSLEKIKLIKRTRIAYGNHGNFTSTDSDSARMSNSVSYNNDFTS